MRRSPLKLESLLTAIRSPLGRIVAGAVGACCVLLIVRQIGVPAIARVLAGAAALFPWVLALEGAQLACTTLALRSLYGPRVTPRQLVRAGLIGYAVMGLVPAGRAVAEVTRASLLTRWVGAARAAAAAVRIQVATLIANAIISAAAVAAVVFSTSAPSWLPLAIAGNGVVALALGASVLMAARRRPGAWLGRVVPRAQGFGADLDGALQAEPLLPTAAIGWELLGRFFQVTQNAVFLACVGGEPTLSRALTSEGIHLVGAALGELIPSQLGATEGNYTLAAGALALPVASAVAIALLAHISQLVWVLAGSLVSVTWPAPPSLKSAPLPEGAASAPRDAPAEPHVPLASVPLEEQAQTPGATGRPSPEGIGARGWGSKIAKVP